jgi:hypothetical protein
LIHDKVLWCFREKQIAFPFRQETGCRWKNSIYFAQQKSLINKAAKLNKIQTRITKGLKFIFYLNLQPLAGKNSFCRFKKQLKKTITAAGLFPFEGLLRL